MSRQLTCPLCGHTFDPASEAACVSCPLRKGCPLVCCPDCGHVTVDTERSRLVQLATGLVHGKRRGQDTTGTDQTLADIAPGDFGVVKGYSPSMPLSRREQLEAYGLSAGRGVVVVQHAPVTVIRVDHTELALEAELATAIFIHRDPTGATETLADIDPRPRRLAR